MSTPVPDWTTQRVGRVDWGSGLKRLESPRLSCEDGVGAHLWRACGCSERLDDNTAPSKPTRNNW